MTLDPKKVPSAVVALIPFAELWGIGDDYEREAAVKRASQEQLHGLAHCLDDIDQKALFEWLAGPESYDPNPTDEYVAFTCLTMAVDSAKQKLKPQPN